MQLSDYITQVQELVHDVSAIDYTTNEMTNYVNNARKRVGIDFHCVRQLFVGLQVVQGQETYPMSNGVGGAIITSGGNYPSAPPTVTFDAAPAGGITATATAVMTGTAVTGIAMTRWGAGYSSVPNVTFSAGVSTATATAVAMLNVMDFQSISVINGIQRAMLLWHPFTYHQAIWRNNVSLSAGQPASWSNYTEQNLFYLYPPEPDQNYPIEIDGVITPSPLVHVADVDTQILDPMADCVQFYAAHLALLKLQNFDQAEYMHKKYKARQQEIQLTRQTTRIPNIYQNVWRRLQRGF